MSTMGEARAKRARRSFTDEFKASAVQLVLKHFGMKKLAATAAEDLLKVFVRRHEAASTVITTNRPGW